MGDQSVERRLTTILAADVVGYSRLMGLDETGTLAALKADQQSLITPLATRYGGRIIKLMGDGILMEFASVIDAVNFAVEVQRQVSARNSDVPEERQLVYRIGVNIGDIIVDGDDIYGDGVNVAARLEPLAPPGGICISRSVRDQIRDKLDYALTDLGDIEVKNIARPIRVFQIALDPTEPSGAAAKRNVRGYVPYFAAGLFVCLAAFGGYLAWQAFAPTRPGSEAGSGTLQIPDKPSIAVLPFHNRSEDQGQEYFADGLTDDLITDLSKVSGLFVIARNSVFTFKGKPVRVDQIASDLGVRYVLEGSVRRSGDQVRVNAQLVEGSTGHQLWAERYDRRLTDLFAVQDELVSRIVSALAVKLTQAEETKLVNRPAPSFEAYDLYLKARDGFFSRDQARMRESLTLFTRAWTLDPTFAKAYAGYAQLAADMWRLSSVRYAVGGATARKAAEVAARKALAIDPTLADAQSVLALMRMVEKRHEDALVLARRAVELDPNSADAHTVLGVVLSYAGRHEAALDAMETAMRVNPRPPPYHLAYYGLALYMNHRFSEAIAALEPIAGDGIRSLGDAPAEILAMAYAMNGQLDKARDQVTALHRDEPFLNLAYYRVVYDHHARREDLDMRLEALRRAGMPEWPLDFREGDHGRISGDALAELTTAKTWTGKDLARDSTFIREMGKDGSVVHATANSLLNGTAFLRDDLLCDRFEGFILGRDLCGPVFERAGGTREGKDEYIYVNPTTVIEFSLSE